MSAILQCLSINGCQRARVQSCQVRLTCRPDSDTGQHSPGEWALRHISADHSNCAAQSVWNGAPLELHGSLESCDVSVVYFRIGSPLWMEACWMMGVGCPYNHQARTALNHPSKMHQTSAFQVNAYSSCTLSSTHVLICSSRCLHSQPGFRKLLISKLF